MRAGDGNIFPRGLLLLSPIHEVLVLPQQHLQRGIDDVIRGAVNKGGVLLDHESNRLFQLVLALHVLRGFVDDRNMFPRLPFFPLTGRGRNTSQTVPLPVCRAGATARFFGQPKAPKSGVAPAHPSVLPASKLNAAPCATFTLPTTSFHPQGERSGERVGDLRLSRTVHRFSSRDRLDEDDFSLGSSRRKRFSQA